MDQCLLGVAQVVILVFQCWLTKVAYDLTKQQKKGIFLIAYNNLGCGERDGCSKKWEYDLTKMLVFYNIGDDFAKMRKSNIIVNDVQIVNDAIPREITFGKEEGRFDTWLVDLKLNQSQLKRYERGCSNRTGIRK